MDLKLNEFECRLLGVLMEKELSQPDYYPMTLNATVAACNQKQNRDPVMSLDEVATEAGLASLQAKDLVTMIYPGSGSRVRRYRHEAEKTLGWQKPERAVMAELLVRGPQTVGELRTRCQRFVQFADLEAVSQVLDRLSQLDPPMAEALPRQPGQTVIRHRQLITDAPDSQPQPSMEVSPAPTPAVPQERPADWRAETADLRQELEDVKRRLSLLEQQRTSE